MLPRGRTTVAIVAGLVLAWTGCGEDAEQLTATELVSRGDAICTEAQRRFTEIQDRAASNSVEVSEQTEELLDVATDEVNELRNLRPPDELKQAYDAYLQAASGVVDLLEQGRDAAEERDGEAFLEAREEANAERAERAKLAQAVGFKVCAQPPEGP
jgi:hypothetical protein